MNGPSFAKATSATKQGRQEKLLNCLHYPKSHICMHRQLEPFTSSRYTVQRWRVPARRSGHKMPIFNLEAPLLSPSKIQPSFSRGSSSVMAHRPAETCTLECRLNADEVNDLRFQGANEQYKKKRAELHWSMWPKTPSSSSSLWLCTREGCTPLISTSVWLARCKETGRLACRANFSGRGGTGGTSGGS